jgi:hypothetical protein
VVVDVWYFSHGKRKARKKANKDVTASGHEQCADGRHVQARVPKRPADGDSAQQFAARERGGRAADVPCAAASFHAEENSGRQKELEEWE